MVHQFSIKPLSSDALSRVKTDKTDNTQSDEELPVLLTFERVQENDVITENFWEYHPCEEQSDEQMKNNTEENQRPMLRKILNTQVSDQAYTQTAPTAGLQESMFMFNVAGELVRILPDGCTSSNSSS